MRSLAAFVFAAGRLALQKRPLSGSSTRCRYESPLRRGPWSAPACQRRQLHGALQLNNMADDCAGKLIADDATCAPCAGLEDALSAAEVDQFMVNVPEWTYNEPRTQIEREVRTRNFRNGLLLVNRIGALAENEGHHPDLLLTYSSLRITLSTHKVKGLTSNDFILAVKINGVINSMAAELAPKKKT